MDSPPFDGAAAFARFCDEAAEVATATRLARLHRFVGWAAAAELERDPAVRLWIEAAAASWWMRYVEAGGSLGELYGVAS